MNHPSSLFATARPFSKTELLIDTNGQRIASATREVLRAQEPVSSRESARPARRAVHQFDPLTDPRWTPFVDAHPKSSIFHTAPWLKSLQQTYGYRPVAYTTSAAGEALTNAIVFCRVESWLTGRRLVSLPFSDHCEPLLDSAEDLQTIVSALEDEVRREKWNYFEFRPLEEMYVASTFGQKPIDYSFHVIDVRPDPETLFKGFHKDSTQRKIRRAEREQLKYEEGRTEAMMSEFYHLLTLTRRRHNLPPQPKSWFLNLMCNFGDALKVRIVRKDKRAIAAMVTLQYKDTLIYKNGGSDPEFHNLGPMHLLYWTCIQQAHAAGLAKFDLGRCDAGQDGLITFKNRWGAKHSIIHYARFSDTQDLTHPFDTSSPKPGAGIARAVLEHLPNSLASLVGRVLYKHVG